ncbi:dCTP pyrophosphatase 1-like [Solanum pennellii]|uniref:dCTP pyrophosphatase 1 n=1 Tax=Solanum pennellii TaxID=28526 RepID=A0ABM1HLM1_SOLPN|nr:dCTP pyrophosphatase 1-like [Solanum pennellii]
MLSLIHFYGYNILPFPNVNKFSPLKSKTRAFANNKSHIYLAKMEQERSMDISLKDLSKQLEDFAKVRNWEKYHSPRNLLLAMVGEVGELSEIFQWRGEVDKGLPNWEESDKEHLGEELSDVLLYLVRLADICGIDLAHAATKKILKNSIKYPEPKVFLQDEDSYN